MGGWTGRGKDGIEWDGWIKSDRFIGDGSELSGIEALPDQTAHAGKYLITDGSTPSWNTVTYRRGATLIVAANDSKDKTNADYICDGTSDDVEILAAMNALSATGGRVLLMDGTFYISSQINIPISNLTIEGQGASTILSATTPLIVFRISTKNSITIKNLKILGHTRSDSGMQGIYFSSSNNTKVINCEIHETYRAIYHVTGTSVIVMGNYFYNFNYEGFRASSLIYSSISNNVFYGAVSAYYGVYLSGGAFGRGTSVNGNAIYFAGIRIETDSTSVVGNAISGARREGFLIGRHENTFSGNMIYNSNFQGISCSGSRNSFLGNAIITPAGTYTAFNLTGSDCAVNGNLIYNINAVGLYLGGNRNTIVGNKFLDIGVNTNNTYEAIGTSGGASYNVIKGNNISSTNANKHKYGIYESSSSADYNVIVGNICTDAATANILTQGVNTEIGHNIA